MEGKTLAVVVTVVFSLVGVLGDYFLKLASEEEHPFKTVAFYVGFGLYAATAFGWLFVMKHLKLATISVLYSVSMIVLLTAVGVLAFGERLNFGEMAGLVMAVGALVLLTRFA
jgi:drug/metabolite transporter (DMT)-like permease